MVSPADPRRAVFLDRDGVLTIPEFRDGRSFAPTKLADFRIYDDAPAAVSALKAAGFLVIVATNQPDVGAGLVPQSVIEEMHRILRAETAVDDVEVCYETRAQAAGQGDEARRKPGCGMLLDAARKWGIDLSGSYMIGDRDSDIEAGRKAGCAALFLDRGYTAEARPTEQAATVTSLAEAADWILRAEQFGRKHERA
ncbi:MAG TPA: HAD-IIIA family hydrolase [Alphaproteobacteria bacterium]|nr:HAD-IIIA family hydrolase [Alphaproteobacteria bacterium]